MCRDCNGSGILALHRDGRDPVYCRKCERDVQRLIDYELDRIAKYQEAIDKLPEDPEDWHVKYAAELENATNYLRGEIERLRDDMRKLAGERIAASGSVQRVEQRVFVVETDSDGRMLRVDLDAPSCECEDHLHRRKVCKHLHAALTYERATFTAKVLSLQREIGYRQLADEILGALPSIDDQSTAVSTTTVLLAARSLS